MIMPPRSPAGFIPPAVSPTVSCFITPPTLEEIALMHKGQTLISSLQTGTLKANYLQALLNKKNLCYKEIFERKEVMNVWVLGLFVCVSFVSLVFYEQ